MKRRQWKKELPPVRNYGLIGGFVGLIFLALYPTVLHPMIFPDAYRRAQKDNRKDIKQEDVQPGNMRIWRDPFDRDKNKV